MKIAVLVATGFEDTELITTLNIFKRNNVDFDLLSVENLNLVRGQNKALLVECINFSNIDFSIYNGLFIPGGKGHKILLENKEVIKAVQMFKKQNKWLFAICAGPRVLVKAQVVDNTKITCHSNYENEIQSTNEKVTVDGKIITAKGFKDTLNFADTIVKNIC